MIRSRYGKRGLKKRYKSLLIINYRQEIIGILMIALFTFLLLSFLSYSPTDNSWFYFSTVNRTTANLCGAFGAHFAALFFFLFGSGSYVLLLSLFMVSLFLLKVISFKKHIFRLSTLPILVISTSTLLSVHQFDFVAENPGGLVGQLTKDLFFILFGRTGSLLGLYAIIWISMIIFARISFVSLFSYPAFAVFSGLKIGAKFLYKNISKSIYFVSLFFYNKIYKNIFSRKKEETVFDENLFQEFKQTQFSAQAKPDDSQSDESADLGVRPAIEQPPAPDDAPSIHYKLPDFSQFAQKKELDQDFEEFEKKCRERGKKLEEKLEHFGVKGKVMAIRPGPVITLFEYKPEIDTKISKIISLEDDLAMALTALSIRIIAPIPGRNVVGFEISNQQRRDVYLSDVIKNDNQEKICGDLPLALGVDITGNPVFQDLVKMPHILVAGSTGSGKSVGLNAMLISLLCRLKPDELKVILIDPKRLEFAPYADIPHLLFPIVTNPHKAVPVMKWVVQEMEDRYDLMAKVGARNISDYHRKEGTSAMPFILLMIDELADLMMVAGKDVETQIARTAQMARAAGIHMIVATQRPSVDVLTGVIKVNFPARIAFRVSSKIDSRTIIDSVGAEKLLGRGDMLFLNSGSSAPQRIHGAYVSSSQINKICDYLKSQQKVEYLDIGQALRIKKSFIADEIEDELYEEIKKFIKTMDEISISLLQRKYRIGFNRSARLIEKLENDGLVAPPHGGKMRKIIKNF